MTDPKSNPPAGMREAIVHVIKEAANGYIRDETAADRILSLLASRPAGVGEPALFGTGDVREDFRAILELLNPLHGELDRQVMDQLDGMQKELGTQADDEFNVNITAKHERDLTQAVMLLESRLRDKAVAGWQPIAEYGEKPKGRVLLWKERTKEHYVASWTHGDHPGWCTPDGFEIFGATHWQPLPAPPGAAPASPQAGGEPVANFDRAWDAILKSDELTRARSRLSIHELRLIIRAAITGKTERIVT